MKVKKSKLVSNSSNNSQKALAKNSSKMISAIVFLIVGAIAGYYFGISNIQAIKTKLITTSQSTPSKTNTTPEPYATPSPIRLANLGISITLPEPFTEQIKTLEYEAADTGKHACKKIYSADPGSYFEICATSRHFTVGRGGRFLGTHGYLESPTGYYILYPFHDEEISKQYAQKIKSQSGVEILKIYGKNKETEFGIRPIDGSPGEGSIGAVINTGDPNNYDGLSMEMKLTDMYTEKVFDQILQSIKLQDDPSSNTIKYVNSRYGYVFNYPKDWRVQPLAAGASDKAATSNDEAIIVGSPEEDLIYIQPITTLDVSSLEPRQDSDRNYFVKKGNNREVYYFAVPKQNIYLEITGGDGKGSNQENNQIVNDIFASFFVGN